ncbi:MAG: xanthine dehydrogenase family protein molybdopterin-binding subunit, partial [Dehalococcoidia bacterium]|nr:xanthine dehydrogenase family protein molybdopterin-binding subunit [Dehalococcoidia bacterium]
MTMTEEPRVIGTRPIRPDGVDKVTGRATYGADVRLPGLLQGRVKRSPHAHAIIKRIDISRALALPGVMAVVTFDDLPAPHEQVMETVRGPMPTAWDSERILARRKVLFRGHPIAAVAALDHHTAEDALELIDIEYEVLPAVVTIDDALRPDSPILHDDGKEALVPGLF